MEYKLIHGNVFKEVTKLDSQSVNCVITSPPYWGLRDYKTEPQIFGGDTDCAHEWGEPTILKTGNNSAVRGKNETDSGNFVIPKFKGTGMVQSKSSETNICTKCGAWRGSLGLEPTPDLYVQHLVELFREIKRVLRKDGTVWLNLGDSFSGSGCGTNDYRTEKSRSINKSNKMFSKLPPQQKFTGLKPKDLVGIPWLVAKALQSPYYTGKIKSERDRIWLASTIDAEGTICGFTTIRKDNGETRRGIHITITNTNMLMLDEAYRIWKTSRQDHNPHGIGHYGKLDIYRWIAHGVEEKAQLLAELYPYFICKKKQALLAWNFLQISMQARGRNKGREGEENRDKSEWIVGALSKLNHLEQVDIPSWIKEPPSLYDQGWWLRSDIIWAKRNCMPESVKDRPTRSHEYIFLLTKSRKYYYDADAIKEPVANPKRTNYQSGNRSNGINGDRNDNDMGERLKEWTPNSRNKRDVWWVSTKPFKGAHFATFPPDLIEPCVLAGCPENGVILDPFSGAGTVGLVCKKHNRKYIGIELNPNYIEMSRKRIINADNIR